MAAEEIENLRYCYAVLCDRIARNDDDRTYWQMNLRLATFFLKRYDAQFNPADRHSDQLLPDSRKHHLLQTHPLLQHPTIARTARSRFTRDLESATRQKVARYFDRR